jgi:hypothetical protein
MRTDFQSALAQIKSMSNPTCAQVLDVVSPLLGEPPTDSDGEDYDNDFTKFLGNVWSLSTCRDEEKMIRFRETEEDTIPVFATDKTVLGYGPIHRILDTAFVIYPWTDLEQVGT